MAKGLGLQKGHANRAATFTLDVKGAGQLLLCSVVFCLIFFFFFFVVFLFFWFFFFGFLVF